MPKHSKTEHSTAKHSTVIKHSLHMTGALDAGIDSATY